MYTRTSYYIPSCFLSISAILESAARQFYLSSQERYIYDTESCAPVHMRASSPFPSSPLKKRASHRMSKSNNPRQTVGVRLLRSSCYLFRKTRGSEISSSFTSIPLFATLTSPPPRSFPLRLVSATRSAEPPQTGTMSRYCDPLQAAESCISSNMFPLPLFRSPYSRSLVVSTLHSASAPALVLALRRVAQCTRLVLYPTCISMGLLVANTESAIPSDR